MPRALVACFTGLVLVSLTTRLPAQEAGVEDMVSSLDSLLSIRISSAAKYDQTIGEAASSVTIITAEDIQRHGYRTLADALASTRGFYLSYDRNYAYLGTRGFSRPSDYNNRVLVLVDGNAVNEGVFGSAPVGTDLGVPLESLERIEVVRGPGSALYGTGAVFAVVNLITRPADAEPGLHAALRGGSYGTRGGTLGYWGEPRSGLGISLGGFWDGSDGHDLFFPEYDAPESGHGRVHHKDWERRWAFFGGVRTEWLTVQGRYSSRTKAIPTGAFETDVVGPASKTRDDFGFLEIKVDRALDVARRLSGRAYVNVYDYAGDYYSAGENSPEAARQELVGAEAALQWDLASRNHLTAGIEVRHDLRARYWIPEEPGSEMSLPGTVLSLYLQDEHQITRSLSLLAGLRHDVYETTRDALSPRVAAIFSPSAASTFKLLYGTAFRAPSLYEIMDGGPLYKPNPDLRPETAQTMEAVWQQRLGAGLLGSVSLFQYDMWRLVDLTQDPVDSLYSYRNVGDAEAYGFELELQARLGRGGSAFASYSHQQATDETTGARLSNSPTHMAKAGLAQELAPRLVVGADARYESSRRTLLGGRTDPAFVTDLHLLLPAGARARGTAADRIELSLRVNNVFDATYATPAGVEHRQAAITQDGRTMSVELRYRF